MNGINYKVPHCEAFFIPHYYPFLTKIFASGSCFQISLVCIPPLMYDLKCLKIWWLAANKSNKQLWTSDEEWSSSLGVWREVNNLTLQKHIYSTTLHWI